MFRKNCAIIEVLVAFCIILDTSSFVRGQWCNCDTISKEVEGLRSDLEQLDENVRNEIKDIHRRRLSDLSTTTESSRDPSLVQEMKSLRKRILELEQERDERRKQQEKFSNYNSEYLAWKNRTDQSLADKDEEIKGLKNNILQVETDLQLERKERKELQDMLENLNRENSRWKTVVKEALAAKDVEINNLKSNISKVETKFQTEHNELKITRKHLKTNTDDIRNISTTLLSFDKNFKEFQWNLQNLNGTLEETYLYYKTSEIELKFYGEWRHEVAKVLNDFKNNLETINRTASETMSDLEKYVEANNNSLKTSQDKASLHEKRIENFENYLQNINISVKTLSDITQIRYTTLDEQLKSNRNESSHSYASLNKEVYELMNEVRYDIEPRVKEVQAILEPLMGRSNDRRQRYVRSMFPKEKTESSSNLWLQK